MAVSIKKEDYLKEMRDYNNDVRNLVMAGYEQAKKGKTKSFDAVCDRLEKKYSNATVHN